jgi:dTDP-4-dehydrorhamnose 3,5-epimerase
MSRFEITETPLFGVSIVTRKPIGDARGFLCRVYSAGDLAPLGFVEGIGQINHTLTRRKGIVRGMHFQYPPHAETKLVSCIRGKIFDVAVDLRRGSPGFLQWHGETLSAENGHALLIPKGFAHGFQTLTDDCELLYLHSAAYERSAEGGLNAADPKLAIAWPLAISDMSERDRNHAMIAPEFDGIDL